MSSSVCGISSPNARCMMSSTSRGSSAHFNWRGDERAVAESNGCFQASKKAVDGVWSMNKLKKLEEEVSMWPHVSVHSHRFGGREYLFDKAEVGHVHTGGIVDIPFPRSVRDALLADGLAEEHRWVPNSGWTAFHVRSEEDLKHAFWPFVPKTATHVSAEPLLA